MPAFYEESIVSCCYVYDGKKIRVIMKNHNTPLFQEIVFECVDNFKWIVTINNNVLVGYEV